MRDGVIGRNVVCVDVDGTLLINKIDKNFLDDVRTTDRVVVRESLCELLGHLHHAGYEIHILTARPGWLESLLGPYSTQSVIEQLERMSGVTGMVAPDHVHRASHSIAKGVDAVVKGGLKGEPMKAMFGDCTEVLLIDDQLKHIRSVAALSDSRFEAFDINDMAAVRALYARAIMDDRDDLFYHPDAVEARVLAADGDIGDSMRRLREATAELSRGSQFERLLADLLTKVLGDCSLRAEAAMHAEYMPDLLWLAKTLDSLEQLLNLMQRPVDHVLYRDLQKITETLMPSGESLQRAECVTQTDLKLKHVLMTVYRQSFFRNAKLPDLACSDVVASAMESTLNHMTLRQQDALVCDGSDSVDVRQMRRCLAELHDCEPSQRLERLIDELLPSNKRASDRSGHGLMWLVSAVMRSDDLGAIGQVYNVLSAAALRCAVEACRKPEEKLQLGIMRSGMMALPSAASKAMVLRDAHSIMPIANRQVKRCLQQLESKLLEEAAVHRASP